MLMSALHRRVHGDFPLDQPSRIGLRQQASKNRIPRAVTTETPVALSYRLPGTETLRQIPPRDPRPIPVNDALNHTAVILNGRPERPMDEGINGSIRAHSTSDNTAVRDMRQVCQTASQ